MVSVTFCVIKIINIIKSHEGKKYNSSTAFEIGVYILYSTAFQLESNRIMETIKELKIEGQVKLVSMDTC